MDQVYPELQSLFNNATVAINNSTFSVGRSLSCDYILDSLEISRLHCVIKKNGDKWTLHDRSSNGTEVNGVLYRFNDSVDLKSGDTIKISDLRFIYNNPSEIAELNATVKTEIVCNPEEVLSLIDSPPGNVEEHQHPKAEHVEKHLKAEPVVEKPVIETPANPPPSLDDKAKIVEDEFTCSICSELFIKAVTLNCSHTFCKYCINKWREKKQICPICRTKITNSFPTRVLDTYIDNFLESRSDDLMKLRVKMTVEREEEEPIAGPSNATSSQVIEISEDEDLGEEEEEDDNLDYSDRCPLDDMDDFDDLDDEPGYNGIPGRYYGGYGSCFICGDAGHWANGCPRKNP